MKVIIAGGRDIENYHLLLKVISDSKFDITEVISGHARGVDQMGERWAKENNIPCQVFPADWSKYGRAAGPIRNKQMSLVGEALIAIKKPKSTGTQNMIDTMKKLKKPIFVLGLDSEGYVLHNTIINISVSEFLR